MKLSKGTFLLVCSGAILLFASTSSHAGDLIDFLEKHSGISLGTSDSPYPGQVTTVPSKSAQ